MFYQPDPEAPRPAGLSHNPFKALVAPRPIGWISTVDADGRPNLAPYSFFNAVADAPPIVMFASNGARPVAGGGLKDTASNAAATGAFVVNVATYALRDAMNASSAPLAAGEDEFAHAGLTPAPSRVVAPPRVAESPAALECRVLKRIDLPTTDPARPNVVTFGEVVGVHIADDAIVDGRVDVGRYRPIARLGYMDYAVVDAVFGLDRPI